MDPIRSDVEQSVQESMAKFDKMNSALKTSREMDDDNAEIVDQAVLLQEDMEDSIMTAQGKLNAMDSDHNSIDSRAKEVWFCVLNFKWYQH